MKKFWIKDVLENRLHNKVRIELRLEERYDAINYPWTMVWETPDQSRHTLSPSTRVIDKFDELGVGRSLLILGEPGAGKTITLLELARDLIERAEQDIDCPIPVVLPLASWGSAKMRKASMIQKKLSSFEDWLVEEISKYNISKKIVQAWLNNQELLLLLDGLDEVSVSYQEECVQSLNYFRQKYGQTEIVVCSRVQEYESLPQRLNFQAAIYLQPLTVQQIEHFFADAGSELEAVRVMFQQDTTLQELAKTPLMLDIIALTYQGVSVEKLPVNKSIQEYRQCLFNNYIERMFFRGQGRHKVKRYHYTQSEAKHWLNWLAQKMIQESQSIFSIEFMQPSLLKFNKLQKCGFNLFITLITIIALLVSGYILGLTMQNVGWSKGLHEGIESVYVWSFLIVVLFIFNEIFNEGSNTLFNIFSQVKILKTTHIILVFASVVISNFMIEIAWTQKWFEKDIFSLQMMQVILSYFLLDRFSSKDCFEYKSSEIPQNKSSLNFAVNSIVLLFTSALGGIVCGSLIYIFFLVSHEKYIKVESLPDMWRFLCLIWKSFFAQWQFLGFSIINLLSDSTTALGLLTQFSLGIGLSLGWLLSFMLAYNDIKHFVLRIIFCKTGAIPWNYKYFLDYAKELVFLQKAGSGYMFIHRLLLEHFALMERNQSLEKFLFRVRKRKQFRNRNLSYVYAESLNICQEILNKRHLEREINVHELVKLYYQQEHSDEAEDINKWARILLKSLVSQNHHGISYNLYNLADIYHIQECYNEAEAIYRLALKLCTYIYIKVNILLKLGLLCYVCKRYEEAEPLFLKVLKIKESLDEKNLPETLGLEISDLTVSNIIEILSSIFLEEKKYKKAEEFILRALKLKKKLLGEEHPNVLSGFVVLACIYELQSRFNEAEALHEKVFEIRLRILGERHLQTIDSLHKLANTYYWQERFSEAESRYLEVIELRKQLLAEDNPDLVVSLYDLGITYCKQARYKEAELLLVQVLEILERQLEEDSSEEVHSNIIFIRENLDAVRAALNSEQETE